jgi:hypothetical protein
LVAATGRARRFKRFFVPTIDPDLINECPITPDLSTAPPCISIRVPRYPRENKPSFDDVGLQA